MERAPIFVKIDDFKDVIQIMIEIKEKTNEAKRLLEKISELRNEEDAELQVWKESMDDIERKIEFISSTLGEPD